MMYIWACAAAGVAAAVVDLFEDDRGLGDAQAGAAVLAPGSAPPASRPRSARGRTRSGRRACGPARASRHRGRRRTARAPPKRMRRCSSGTRKSIALVDRLRRRCRRSAPAPSRMCSVSSRDLSWPRSSRPMNTRSSRPRTSSSSPVVFDAHDLVPQAEAGATDARSPRCVLRARRPCAPGSGIAPECQPPGSRACPARAESSTRAECPSRAPARARRCPSRRRSADRTRCPPGRNRPSRPGLERPDSAVRRHSCAYVSGHLRASPTMFDATAEHAHADREQQAVARQARPADAARCARTAPPRGTTTPSLSGDQPKRTGRCHDEARQRVLLQLDAVVSIMCRPVARSSACMTSANAGQH